MSKAFDPIIYDTVDINTWLNQEDDNIIVILKLIFLTYYLNYHSKKNQSLSGKH